MSRSEPLPPPLAIWIVNPLEDIPGEGLPTQRSWSLARILAARGHDVTWWSATWSPRRKATRTTPLAMRDEENFAVRLVAVRPYAKNMSLARIGSQRDFGRTFERLASEGVASGQLERPDIILACFPPLEASEAAARLARRLDAVFVCDVMDASPDGWADYLPVPGWIRSLAASLVSRGAQKRRDAVFAAADAISASSETSRDAVTVLPGVRGRNVPTHLCHLGAYLQEYPEPPRRTPADLDASHATDAEPVGPVRCVYAGSLEAGRDLDALVAATRLLATTGTAAEIHAVGTGELEGRLRSAAVSTGSTRLIVHGLLPRSDYGKLLSRADVGLVLAAANSGVAVPYKACDYAAAGLAIVNGLPGELERLVAEHAAGLTYKGGEAASLARAIAAFAADRRLLAACRTGSRGLAEAMFDREKTYLRFAAWLEGCTAS